MTRFWITLEQAAYFVLQSLRMMNGGEIFVPKLPTMKIVDVAKAIGPECELDEIGIRPGEKLHEVLVTEDEARRTCELDNCYVVKPGAVIRGWSDGHLSGAKLVEDNFRYSSDSNDWLLTSDELRGKLYPQPVQEHLEKTSKQATDLH
jgi:UDP-N-acetylglucosamine 4,6-dehydratase